MHLDTSILRGVIVARWLLLRTTLMDVSAWLRGLGLERYTPAFRDNDILPELTADDLTGLGVTSVGHRRRLGWLLSLKGDPGGAERTYIASLDWARTQQAMSWELRTAMSYARLLRDQGRSRRRTSCTRLSTAGSPRASRQRS
jgi:hypothetical protein